jgi:hypothetical protein
MLRPARLLVLSLAALALSGRPAHALNDEIQVYLDDMDEPGRRGLELHINNTPRGRATQDYPGDLPPQHVTRITPEFSQGLTRDLEGGLYLPMAMDSSGTYYLGGAKLRLKWIPLHSDEAKGGWYAGANLELSNVRVKFSESRYGSELRLIGGYRNKDWLIGYNPIFEWNLSPGYRGSPELMHAWKLARRVADRVALGGEYYDGVGTLAHRLPGDEHDRTLYLVADIENSSWDLNIGIGRGLNSATDRWTVKAIIALSFD